ncbi:AAA family ATPase [Vibrio parahaemolyticus]|uniref:restriction endonuclease n=2 Tax=Vibrio TaxID=662 RepID=UPI001D5C2AB2|nr:restriction endonuclease [Vibrio parahaemolyticus]EGR3149406.1 hypothetical protein [Vibrio parahaemolyticus]EGR3163034.1 hypothetical protein [Vibrio parahaemolyticus]EJG0319453.1 AAA family ATPase [Vibrio parahaemolyticus]EJG0430582.1 AAA family ATPase [Vibrio parahaemolyticus]EKK9993128.1 AAA family ATPase [Vibrio parahaemolyticus]
MSIMVSQEFIEPSDIEQEIAGQQQTSVIEVGAQSLPYQNLDPAQFECLLWDLFRSGFETDLGHDYTRLMLTGADQGRDVWMTSHEIPVGLVQCKRYSEKITLRETIKEIVKFLLYADLNRKLLPKPDCFTYYLALSCDPTGEVDEFFNTPSSWLRDNPEEIETAAKAVIAKYASLKMVDLSCAMLPLRERFQALNYRLLRPHELDRALSIHTDVRERHFRIPVHSLQLSRAPFSGNTTAVPNDLAQASRHLACWQKTIENRFIERPELQDLLQLVHSNESSCHILTGVSGSGKSSLLSALYERLPDDDFSVLAIKADELDAKVNDLTELAESLKLSGNLTNTLLGASQTKPVVLLIDQMDAVSEVMDQSSNRFRVLVDLVVSLKSRFESIKLSGKKPVHIIVTSRPFEASFDTRFTQLEAKHIELPLPEKSAVEALLTDLGIEISSIPPSMYPAIQVPFALNLYVSLIKAGEHPSQITSKNLLQRWLDKKLTDRASRAEQMLFLKRLAQDMVSNEVLRRPVDAYQFESGHVIAALEAAGILVRYDKNIGFSHQAWLDDFQAQSFSNSDDLCSFVYQKQDGLFSRSTILRGLESLRERDPMGYQSTLDSLLFGGRSRRHILHLLVDILAISPTPSASDAERVIRLINDDVVLAKRAISKVAANWSNWRDHLIASIPEIMEKAEYSSHVVEWLIAESKHDEEHVISLLNRLWFEPTYDEMVLNVLWRSSANSEAALRLVEQLISRNNVDSSYVGRYLSGLCKKGHGKPALNILVAWLNSVDDKTALEQHIYGFEKLARKHSLECIEAILPWVVQLIEKENSSAKLGYSYRRTIRSVIEWNEQSDNSYLLGGLRLAIAVSAKNTPNELLHLVRPYMAVDIDDVQVIVASALLSNGKHYAQDIYDYLLGDRCRLQLGSGYFKDEDNVGYTFNGSVTLELIEEAVSFWDDKQVAGIRDAIEQFSSHQPSADYPADMKLRCMHYSEGYRLALLSRLPSKALSPRRNRQVSERHIRLEPAIGERSRGVGMASVVRSPMSSEQMGKARKEDILNLLNEITDQHKRHGGGRRWLSGGVIELSRSFGSYAANNPEQAIELITDEFRQGLHEYAASEAIENLAKSEVVATKEIVNLIIQLNQRGFNSKEWITGVARAFQAIAGREYGLDDQCIQILLGYLNSNLDTGFELEGDRTEAEPGQALLFGHDNGFRTVPAGNYTIMSAIHYGLLCRQPPSCDAWADVLLQFLDTSQDTETWKCLLLFQFRHLRWASQDKCNELVHRLVDEHTHVFSLPTTAMTIWELADVLQPETLLKIVRYWLSSKSSALIQVAGEFITGQLIIGNENNELHQIWNQHFSLKEPHFMRGIIHAACSGWQETGKVRGDSHKMLMACLQGDTKELVTALNSLFSYSKQMPNDELTYEVVDWLAGHPEAVSELNRHCLISNLVKINFSPKLQLSILDIAKNLVISQQKENPERQYFEHSEELVQLAVTLQRGAGAIKEGAITLYETLLDAGNYQAEEAAQEALRL